MYLTDDYGGLTRWAFPPDAVLSAGEFKVVFTDGQPGQTTTAEWHTGFRLEPEAGSIALAWTPSGSPQVLDYLNYTNLPANGSFGDFPDAQPFFRESMLHATPGAANTNAVAPVVVRINEWMAGNTVFLQNPVDGSYDDWFELCNPGVTPADLGGLYLTDNLVNPTQFQIPNNGHYVIPPGGFLLVWANNQSSYNATNRPDLFVNFALARSGEAIGLYGGDGTLIDAVTFGAQTNNLSEGLYPDGSGPRYFMSTPTPRAPNSIPVPPQEPELGGVEMLPGNVVSFTVSTVPGHVYRVEYRDDLGAGAWLPLLPDITATTAGIIVTDNPGTNPQRFYRVLLVE
jgi:hypothetical protein